MAGGGAAVLSGGSRRVAVTALSLVLAAAATGFGVWSVTTSSAGRLAWMTSMATIAATVLSAWVVSVGMLAWVLHSGRSKTGEVPVAAGGLPVGPPVGRLPVEVRGRDALLAELRGGVRRPAFMRFAPLSQPLLPGRAWILAGMGGLGKSTIALAIAREARRSKRWRVWWVTATDRASLAGGIVEILGQLDAPEAIIRQVREGTPAAAEHVWDYLNGAHRAGPRWLLIFDNADDPAVLAAPGAASPADYTGWLRPDPRGVVIVTTRHLDRRAWGHGIPIRELPPLDDDAAAQVLADLAPEIDDPDGRQARELARRLGGLPLGLHLAGTYLGSRLARWRTFTDYHRALDGAELPAALVAVSDPAGDARTDIQRTWGLSLDALAADGLPQASPLLLLLACYAPATVVPVAMLRPRLLSGLLGDTTGEASDAVLRQRMLAGLRGLATTGLIDVAAGNSGHGEQTVTVHRVVADTNRVRLCDAAADLPVISATAVRLLKASCDELDGGGPGDWPAWHGLVPHILALLDWIVDLLAADTLAELLEVSSATAEALVLGGAVGTAETLARTGVALASRLAADDPARLATRLALAAVVAEQGHVEDAERLYRELLIDAEPMLGSDHPAALAVRYQHVRMLGFMRPLQAEQPHRTVLADLERVLGRDHPDTLAIRHWLGRLLMRLGRYQDAEVVYLEVLDGRRRRLGDDHPDTLVTRHTLAWAIARQGRYPEAERQFRQIIKDQKDTLGSEHHYHVLGSGRALGWCILMQGRHAEAERQLRQVLAAQQRVRGDDHPATADTVRTLADAIGRQGRYAEAEDLYLRALNGRPPAPGVDRPATLTTYHMLGLLLAEQSGRRAEARQVLTYALEGRERALGAEHPDTAATRQALERLNLSQARQESSAR